MKINELSIEKLRELVEGCCCTMSADYEELKAGEQYFCHQDRDYVYVTDDDGKMHYLNYAEAELFIDRVSEI